MRRISFNVGNCYFSPIGGPAGLCSPGADIRVDQQCTHVTFEDDDHLEREWERIRAKKTERRSSDVFTVTERKKKSVEMDWSIIKRIKDTYDKVKSELDHSLMMRKFVFYVNNACHTFTLYSPESDITGCHSTRFWFHDNEDLEKEWNRIREKMMAKWPTHGSSFKQTRFIDKSSDMEWWLIDGIKQTYLWELRRNGETQSP